MRNETPYRRMKLRKWTAHGVLAAACLALGACTTLGYYGQAINGEMKILSKRRPLKAVIADPDTSAEVRSKLEWVIEARQYAIGSLDLPDGDSYHSYVALDRRYPVWAVYAAPEFSLVPRSWCYPFAGCVPYRGYFDRKSAEAFAAKLEKKGDDVSVDGVPAYSTLGWFADPVYAIMLEWGRAAIAGMIFHEMAHQKLYVKGDAAFNESFADTVEWVGLKRFLTPRDPQALVAWRNFSKSEDAMTPYLKEARASLAVIYRSQVAPAQMREEKRAEFAWLVARYHEVGARYDIQYSEGWLARLNNATLAQANVYDRWVPAFRQLLQCAGGDLPAFYQAAARIARMDADARAARLSALAASEDSRAAGNADCAQPEPAESKATP